MKTKKEKLKEKNKVNIKVIKVGKNINTISAQKIVTVEAAGASCCRGHI